MTDAFVVEPTLLDLADWLTSQPLALSNLDRHIAAELLRASFRDERAAALGVAGVTFLDVETAGPLDHLTRDALGRFIGKPPRLAEQALRQIMGCTPNQDRIPPWLRQSERRMRFKSGTLAFFDVVEGVLRRSLVTGRTAILARIGLDMSNAWRPYAVVPDRRKLGPSGKTTIRLVEEMIAGGELVAFARTGLTFGGAEWLAECRRDIARTSKRRTIRGTAA